MAGGVMPLMLGISRLSSLIPCVSKHDVAIAVLPGNFFIAKLYAFKVVMLLFGCIFSIMHHW